MPSLPPSPDAALAQLSAAIDTALRRMFAGTRERGGVLASPATLRQVCRDLLGEHCPPEDQRRFMLAAAPLMRAIVFDYAGRRGTTQLLTGVANLKDAVARLHARDPECGRMVDLHFFCGFSAPEVAAVLGMSAELVDLRLRFARSWLQAPKR